MTLETQSTTFIGCHIMSLRANMLTERYSFSRVDAHIIELSV